MNSTLRNVLYLAAALSVALPMLYFVSLMKIDLNPCDMSKGAVNDYTRCTVTADDLIAKPDLFHSVFVLVKGEFNFGIENNLVYGSGSKGSVWVMYPPSFYTSRDHYGSFVGVVKARFNKFDSGHMGQSKGGLYDPVIMYEK